MTCRMSCVIIDTICGFSCTMTRPLITCAPCLTASFAYQMSMSWMVLIAVASCRPLWFTWLGMSSAATSPISTWAFAFTVRDRTDIIFRNDSDAGPFHGALSPWVSASVCFSMLSYTIISVCLTYSKVFAAAKSVCGFDTCSASWKPCASPECAAAMPVIAASICFQSHVLKSSADPLPLYLDRTAPSSSVPKFGLFPLSLVVSSPMSAQLPVHRQRVCANDESTGWHGRRRGSCPRPCANQCLLAGAELLPRRADRVDVRGDVRQHTVQRVEVDLVLLLGRVVVRCQLEQRVVHVGERLHQLLQHGL